MAATKRLSKKSRTVLSLIADGHSYSQIVDGHREISYLDVFRAAEEALTLLDAPGDYDARMAAIKERHPRAYEKWSAEEDDSLRALHGDGHSLSEIADRLQRQPGAIRSRLTRLGIGPEAAPGGPRAGVR